MHCEPAASIIKKLGGLSTTAEAASVTVTSVQRWRMPRDKGGTGGLVPLKHVQSLIGAAQQAGISLSFAEFEPKTEPAE